MGENDKAPGRLDVLSDFMPKDWTPGKSENSWFKLPELPTLEDMKHTGTDIWRSVKWGAKDAVQNTKELAGDTVAAVAEEFIKSRAFKSILLILVAVGLLYLALKSAPKISIEGLVNK